MSALLDSLLTKEQRASCAEYDAKQLSNLVATHRSGFCAMQGLIDDSKRQPAEACTDLGVEDLIEQSESDPWLWALMPVVFVLSLLAAWIQFGWPA